MIIDLGFRRFIKGPNSTIWPTYSNIIWIKKSNIKILLVFFLFFLWGLIRRRYNIEDDFKLILAFRSLFIDTLKKLIFQLENLEIKFKNVRVVWIIQ